MPYAYDEAARALSTLEDMKAVLLEGGWRKGSVGALQRGQPTCLLGSYAIAIDATPKWNQILFYPGIRELVKVCGMVPSHWNDHPDRTFPEVIDAIDQAILLVKEESQ